MEEEIKKEETVSAEKLNSATSDDVKMPEPEVEAPIELPKVDVVTAPTPKLYMGKEIIAEKMVEVNEKQYHSLTLSDGSVQLLSPSEYKELTA